MKKIRMIILLACTALAVAMACSCTKKEAEETAAETSAAETSTEEAAETQAAEGESVEQETLSRPENYGTVVLPEYKGLKTTLAKVVVTDEDVDATIQEELDANPDLVEVARAAQEGDTVNIDYEGKVSTGTFSGGSDSNYDLVLGSGSFIEGFESGLVGSKAGDTVDLKLKFPDDYWSEDMAGQDVTFTVKVNAVKEEQPAQLTDEWVKNYDIDGKMGGTVDGMKKYVREYLEENQETSNLMSAQSDIFNQVLEAAQFDISQEALDYEFEKEYDYYKSYFSMYGMDLKTALEDGTIDRTQMEEELKTAADSTCRQQILVDAIIDAEKLTVTDDDFAVLAELYGSDKDTMFSAYGEESVTNSARAYKVVRFLYDNAVVTRE